MSDYHSGDSLLDTSALSGVSVELTLLLHQRKTLLSIECKGTSTHTFGLFQGTIKEGVSTQIHGGSLIAHRTIEITDPDTIREYHRIPDAPGIGRPWSKNVGFDDKTMCRGAGRLLEYWRASRLKELCLVRPDNPEDRKKGPLVVIDTKGASIIETFIRHVVNCMEITSLSFSEVTQDDCMDHHDNLLNHMVANIQEYKDDPLLFSQETVWYVTMRTLWKHLGIKESVAGELASLIMSQHDTKCCTTHEHVPEKLSFYAQWWGK